MAELDIQEFIWEPGINDTHIWERHHRTREEVEDVCYGDPKWLKGEDTKEGRLRVIGPRADGKRLLAIILASQGSGSFYPVTAKPPNRQERRRYTAWKEEKISHESE
ncbi:MAG: hypothetical protein IVW57_10995 [Ktedonobacterales bacterium]|nr:hypothetical protein [Ktedonobacterales bacterium]